MLFASFNLAISPVAYAYSEREAEELKEKVLTLQNEIRSSMQGENGRLNVAQTQSIFEKLEGSLPVLEFWVNEKGTEEEKEEFQVKIRELKNILALLGSSNVAKKSSMIDSVRGVFGQGNLEQKVLNSDIESGPACDEGSESGNLSQSLMALCPLLPTDEQASEFQALLVSTNSVAPSLSVQDLLKEIKNNCDKAADDPSGETVTISVSIPCIICLLIIAFGIYSAVVLLAFPKSDANIYK